jgi:hypothetical protein
MLRKRVLESLHYFLYSRSAAQLANNLLSCTYSRFKRIWYQTLIKKSLLTARERNPNKIRSLLRRDSGYLRFRLVLGIPSTLPCISMWMNGRTDGTVCRWKVLPSSLGASTAVASLPYFEKTLQLSSGIIPQDYPTKKPKEIHTTAGIRWWSPTQLLICRSTA